MTDFSSLITRAAALKLIFVSYQHSSSMATKRLSGLCTPFNKLCRNNASAVNAITQRTYATVDEGDTQVTHTGQVSYSSFVHCFI